MTTRARFEKWAESSGWNIDRTDEGDYRTMSTDAAWGGWSACAEAEHMLDGFNPKRRPIDELVERIKAVMPNV